MSSPITLQQALAVIDGKGPFAVKVITADVNRGTGGEELFIPMAWKHSARTTREERALQKKSEAVTRYSCNPNHYDNSTRNLKLPNGEIRKIHIRLLREVNGQIVL
jgi:hypothetical protein